MRSILLHVCDDDRMEARLQVALDLARTLGAHLTCLQPVSFDFAAPGDIYGTMVGEMLPAIRTRADTLCERLRVRLSSEDVVWDWRQEEGAAISVMMRAEGLADLVVVGAGDPANKGGGQPGLASHTAVHGRAPVLIVPPTVRALDCTGPAVIGWNGSPEAAHALRGTAAVLAKASSVALVTVVEPDAGTEVVLPAIDAAEYLSRHAIASEILAIERGHRTVGQALADAAAEREAAYLVIGAYGHPRSIETVFGGVSRELLTRPPLPVFTTH